MLSDRNADGVAPVLLHIGIPSFEHACRPREVHPRPAVLVGVLVGPLLALDGKEVINVCLVGGDDDRLAVNPEPRILVQSLGVNVVVQTAHDICRAGMRVEHDLRRIKALLVQLVARLHDRQRVIQIIVAVGDIEVQEIHVCLRQQFGVLAVHPLVIGVVVAVERLGEPVHGAHGSVLAGLGNAARHLGALLIQNLLQVENAAVAVLAVPEEVEQTDIAFAFLGVDAHNVLVGGGIELAPEVVGADQTAAGIVMVVGNGIADRLPVEQVGDGHGRAVLGDGVGQGSCVVIQIDCDVVFGARSDDSEAAQCRTQRQAQRKTPEQNGFSHVSLSPCK